MSLSSFFISFRGSKDATRGSRSKSVDPLRSLGGVAGGLRGVRATRDQPGRAAPPGTGALSHCSTWFTMKLSGKTRVFEASQGT